MSETDLWESERRFWLEGASHFRAVMAPDCLMVFPAPTGILTGAAIIDALQDAPRWQSVEMSEQAAARADAAVALAYRALARRGPDESAYLAYCSSTYVKTAEGWRLVQHQQTPA